MNNSSEKGDDIVVTGMSGRLPQSRNIKEFATNLFNKVDLVDDSEERWKHVYDELPNRFGKISDVDKFDSSFFSMLNVQAKYTDPQMRILLEHTYEAILDAGISPQTLIGSNTGVFVGCCTSDSKDSFINQTYAAPHSTVTIGNSTFSFSNRVSYTLGLSGPSLTLDTACSSSGYALDCAFHYLNSGVCDAAIVAGTQLTLVPSMFFEYESLGILSKNGVSRPFDESANGLVRAEAICAIFLQKRKDAKRIYAQIINSKTNNDGFKKEGSTLPSKQSQEKLMKRVYKDLNFNPAEIKIVEAHSTSTVLGDFQEVSAIDAVFCENRSDKLIIGSVKSNTGHAEAASGIVSTIKILIALDNGKFPPNINLMNLRKDIPAFAENRIEVATETIELTSPYIAQNSFGIGGSNAHILFKQNLKVKDSLKLSKSNLEYMVLWSGRTEDAIHTIFDDISSKPLDVEFLALLHNSQIKTLDANSYRGYGIFKNNEDKASCITRNIQHFDGVRREIVFVYAGMGTQWFKMGQDLMQIPLFASSIEKSHEILKKKDVDLKSIITSNDPTIYENFLNSSLGIISIEMALTDILHELNIKPDWIIGHSFGEIGCSYADGCFTREEALITAYLRAKITLDSGIQGGSMAAIGMHYSELEKITPKEIDIACQNSKELTTISGPKNIVADFVDYLKSQHCFAREVACVGVPFHSRYIKEVGIKFRDELAKTITNPKVRSSNWITATYPEECVDSKFCDASYHANNYMNPVFFENAAKRLPQNALAIEISPHGFLQSLLKSALKKSVYVGLTNKNKSDGKALFFEGIGKIFQYGVDVDISKLYPNIEFPVSRGTPMISPLIKWNHSQSHFVPYFDPIHFHAHYKKLLNFRNKDFEFLKHHVIDDKPVVAAAFWVYLAWKNFAIMHGMHFENMRVTFRDLECLRATYIPPNDEIVITVSINSATGKFELMEGKTLAAQGYIERDDNLYIGKVEERAYDKDAVILTTKDFYKHARVLGYQYVNEFQQIHEITDDGLMGKVKWNKNWTAFIDCVIQSIILTSKFHKLELPLKVKKISIDPFLHKEAIDKEMKKLQLNNENTEDQVILLPFETDSVINMTRCAGIAFYEPTSIAVNRKIQKNIALESSKFVPFTTSQENFEFFDAIKCSAKFYFENNQKFNYKIIEIDNNEEKTDFVVEIFSKINRQYPVSLDLKLLTPKNVDSVDAQVIKDKDISTFTYIDIVYVKNCLQNEELVEKVYKALAQTGVLITQENLNVETSNERFDIMLNFKIKSGNRIIMMRKKKEETELNAKIFEISSNIEYWIEDLKQELQKMTDESNEKKYDSIILHSNNSKEDSGILGFFNCLRLEHPGINFKCFMIDDESAPNFDIENEFYKKQLSKNLVINIFKNGQWGCYQYLNIQENNQLEPFKDNCFASYTESGNLSTLKWRNGALKNLTPESCNKDLMKIQYAALNFRDVVFAYGYLPDEATFLTDSTIGLEFAGVLAKTGKRLTGIALNEPGIATYFEEPNMPIVDIPDDWTMEDAATIPVAYLTVYFAFFETIKIEAGKSILIHSGAGGVGQAAIHVAFGYGLEVYTTVGTKEKRKFLLETFPKLKPQNIGNSRDTSFYNMVMKETNGKGVDYVLNSLFDDKMLASVKCLAKFGVMLEIGVADILKGTKTDLKYLEKFATIKWVKIDRVDRKSPEITNTIEHIKRDISSGIVKPLSRTVFDAKDIAKAFQYMSTGNHIGKVLIKIRENENDEATVPINVTPRFYCNSDQSYIVVGGLGGLGLEFSQWLIGRKCKKLILSSSRGISNQYQAYKIKYWKSFDVEITVNTSDVTTAEGCEQLIKAANNLGPVGGIFNFAVVLNDGVFLNQTTETFNHVLAPKAIATKHLHEQSLKLCPKLKHFVIYSSISCGRGNTGQSNYGMANSVMERIIEKRHSMGLPAKAIQLGAIGDVGVFADVQHKIKVDFEIPVQSIASLLEHHDALLLNPEPIMSCMATFKKKGVTLEKEGFIDMLMRVLNIEDRKTISMNSTFSQLGIDSLGGVEMMQMIEREYGVTLTSNELRSLTISELEARVMINSKTIETESEEVNYEEMDF
ncbi:hypothetical protein PVAND_012980 [Polypedilum vanderplanki]|uniref:Uncharacterized protein n=1 Tax=Polypedilum vanderplanki TaxID=319348 RepID=A0A9J6CQ25_POLVA|nr:hypothetical protein PVAND_012980 [Polypedilum vanderplanki]